MNIIQNSKQNRCIDASANSGCKEATDIRYIKRIKTIFVMNTSLTKHESVQSAASNLCHCRLSRDDVLSKIWNLVFMFPIP